MTKRENIVQAFRDEIASGVLKPGDRLPVRKDIERRFGASLVTVQRAMEQLINEGWLVSNGCRGTNVAETPPHLNHYGLFFPYKDEERQWPRFWYVVKKVAEEVLNRPPAKLTIFYGLDLTASLEQYQEFHDTLCTQRLAGMFFASWPVPQLTSFLEREPKLPCAIFASRPIPGMVSLSISSDRFFSHACKLASSLDRREIAALIPSLYITTQYMKNCRQQLRQHKLNHHPGWIQAFTQWSNFEAINAQLELLFCNHGGPVPNVLYLGDDNLVAPVAKSLGAMGKRVPEDVEIICWGAAPWSEVYDIPIRRICVDLHPLIEGAKETIDNARQGGEIEAVINTDVAEISC